MFNKTVSLVVPVYNEADIIGETINVFLQGLSRWVREYEIVIVDDGSTDRTIEILEQIVSKNDCVKLLKNPRNMGSGISLWRGMQLASKDYILTNFADRPFDVGDLGLLMEVLVQTGVDFIVVVRSDRRANSLYRKLTSITNWWLIKILFRLPIQDCQFVQIYKANILKGVQLDSSGTFVPPELMSRLIDKGCSFEQVTCTFHSRSGGYAKCGNWATIRTTLVEMFRYWKKRQRA